jgi:hypothetical protein
MVQCLVDMTFSSVQIWQRQSKLPEGWFGNFVNFRNLKYSPKYFEFGNSVTFVLRAFYSMLDSSRFKSGKYVSERTRMYV